MTAVLTNHARLEMVRRGIAEARSTPRRVITVYRTSKIDKYWRRP